MTRVLSIDSGENFCRSCANGASIDDSIGEFYEGARKDGKATLRHKKEGNRSLRLPSVIKWTDTLPDYPRMEATANAGCRLCGLVRRALLRRDIPARQEPVDILCAYVWDGNAYGYYIESDLDEGLVYMRCEVFGLEPKIERLAYIVFLVETNDEDVACWLRARRRRAAMPFDSANIEWIASELDTCDNKCVHEKLDPATFRPTRLVDVGQSGGMEPRLVVSSDLDMLANTSAVKYAALSYCWGPEEDAERQLKTDSSTYNSHRHAMPLHIMTPVMRDAVVVCRSLGIRYLWIDALCIIQDDIDDWGRESEEMGLIYYYSYLTICPLASRSCLEGFLAPRESSIQINFRSSRKPTIRGAISLYESHNDRDYADLGLSGGLDYGSGFDLRPPRDLDMSLAAWSTRGWTFQEENSSFRMLYLGKNMLHFVCPSRCCSENGFTETGENNVLSPIRELISLSISKSTKPDLEVAPWESSDFNAGQIWEMVSSITQRKFTYRQDIFPAIAGIARAAAQVQDDLYLAGLWRKSLHRGLLWYTLNPKSGNLNSTLQKLQDSSLYVSPSWSWVCSEQYFECLAPSSYSIMGVPDHQDGGAMFTLLLTRPSHLRQEMSLLDYRTERDGNDVYGTLKRASLILRGRVIQFPSNVFLHPKSKLAGRPPAGYFAGKLGSIFFDWSVDEEMAQPSGDMVLFLTASCCQGTSNEVLRFMANPREDHSLGLGERDVHANRNDVSRTEAIKESENCLSCRDGLQSRNAWGLVLHPAWGTSAYYRVGAFVLFGHSGGLKLFEGADYREVEII